MNSHVKGLVMLSLINISVVGSKCPSSQKTTIHETFSFWEHTNKNHTQRSTNLLQLLRKFHSPAYSVCVATVAVQSWQTDFHRLHERLPWLVQHSGLILIQVILEIHERLEKYSSYITVQWTSDPASKCVFSNREHCPLSACSPKMWL
jgi:hypothetical protein